jgi:hypothetical protein
MASARKTLDVNYMTLRKVRPLDDRNARYPSNYIYAVADDGNAVFVNTLDNLETYGIDISELYYDAVRNPMTSDLDASGFQIYDLKNITLVPQASNPVSGPDASSTLWYNSTNSHLYVGGADLQSGGGGSLPTATIFGQSIFWNGSAYEVTRESVYLGQYAGASSTGTGGEFRVGIGQEAGLSNQGGNAIAIGNTAGGENQGTFSVAIGSQSGACDQNSYAVAIGANAANDTQGSCSVAIGAFAGYCNQDMSAVAIGFNAGYTSQGPNSVAIGLNAGSNLQSSNAVAIGNSAGLSNQGPSAIAIGSNAGYTSQGPNSVTIGLNAGSNLQSSNAVAIGNSAGLSNQGPSAIAIGSNAGYTSQGKNSVAIGANAGSNLQSSNAVAIGNSAGLSSQKQDAVAIGVNAGTSNQSGNAVAIGNAAGASNQQLNSVAIGVNAGTSNQSGNAVAIGSDAGGESQRAFTVAIGNAAGVSSQASSAIAIGRNAGSNIQGTSSIAIGMYAGNDLQKSNAIAIGNSAGLSNQGSTSVAIGNSAGVSSQGSTSVAIGNFAGNTSQLSNAVAIGNYAGSTNQKAYSVAIGSNAGSSNQGSSAVSIGNSTGQYDQSSNAIAIGNVAGYCNQGPNSIAIGIQSGQFLQQTNAISIGYFAGQSNQGSNAIAIGTSAGLNNQPNNSIVLNATGSTMNGDLSNATYIAPVRTNDATVKSVMGYDLTRKEVVTTSALYSLNGNVGIGTNAPAVPLDVSGTVQVTQFSTSTATTASVLSLRNANAGGRQLMFYTFLSENNYNDIVQTGDKGILYDGSGLVIAPSIGGVGGVRMDNSGIFTAYDASDIGIIALKPNGNTGHVIRFGGPGSNANKLAFVGPADTEYMQLDNGKVGIGTNAPAYTLDVSGDTKLGKVGQVLPLLIQGGTSGTSGVQIEGSDTTNATWRIGTPSSGVIGIGGNSDHKVTFGYYGGGNVSYTEFVRIDSSEQHVGIGTSTPSVALEVSGNVIVNGTLTSRLKFIDHSGSTLTIDSTYFGAYTYVTGPVPTITLPVSSIPDGSIVIIINDTTGSGTITCPTQVTIGNTAAILNGRTQAYAYHTTAGTWIGL